MAQTRQEGSPNRESTKAGQFKRLLVKQEEERKKLLQEATDELQKGVNALVEAIGDERKEGLQLAYQKLREFHETLQPARHREERGSHEWVLLSF